MKTLIFSLFAVAVVGGGGYFVWQNMQAPATISGEENTTTGEQTQNTNTQTNTEEEFSGSGSFASLMARGGSYQCTTSIEVQNSTSEGTVFISGDKIRGDFTSRAAGMTIDSYMIMTDGYVYGWSDMVPHGYKAKATATVTTSQGSFDVNTDMEYDCKPWTPDQSKFIIPTGITFTEAPTE